MNIIKTTILSVLFLSNVFSQDDFYLTAKVKIYSNNKTGQVFTKIIKSTSCDHYDSLAIIESYNRVSITPFKGKSFNLNTVCDIKFKVPKDSFLLCSPELKNIPKELNSNNNFEFRLCILESDPWSNEKNIKPSNFTKILARDYKVYYVSPITSLTIDDIDSISMEEDKYEKGLYIIDLRIAPSSMNKFYDLTKNNVGNNLCLFIEGKCIISPKIKGAQRERTLISQLNYEDSKFILDKFYTYKNK